jgi:hypothetical protein
MIEKIQKTIAGNLTLIPLQGVQFLQMIEWGDDADINYIAYNLEAESNLKLTPIERNTDKGFSKQMGYIVEANLYLPYNSDASIVDINGFLLGYLQKRYSVTFLLGTAKAWSEVPHDMPQIYNATDSKKITIANYNIRHLVEFETVEFRLRAIIRIKGFVTNTGIVFA